MALRLVVFLIVAAAAGCADRAKTPPAGPEAVKQEAQKMRAENEKMVNRKK